MYLKIAKKHETQSCIVSLFYLHTHARTHARTHTQIGAMILYFAQLILGIQKNWKAL